jgi:hypothetical protein
MGYQPDIVLRNEYGSAVAWVEAKATKIQGAQHWAGFYKFAQSSGPPRGVRYLLLVTLVEVSLWDWSANANSEILRIENLPTHTAQLPRFLDSQISRRVVTDARTLADMVFQWLIHIREFNADENDPAECMLLETGFVKALHDARVEFGAAA